MLVKSPPFTIIVTCWFAYKLMRSKFRMEVFCDYNMVLQPNAPLGTEIYIANTLTISH